jgi:hypothetical protein
MRVRTPNEAIMAERPIFKKLSPIKVHFVLLGGALALEGKVKKKMQQSGEKDALASTT